MRLQEIIRKKRDGLSLSAEEIAGFIKAATLGEASEGQIGAFTMAVYLRGMNAAETVALSLAMRDSGQVLDWKKVGINPERVIEKHSSGGVGDEKITLIVVPLAAACGVYAPNLSARGLDYCAGEVDLLDAIPGYQTSPTPEFFMRAVKEAGGAISGPTLDLAPADRKLFYVRDVTATVESVPLITGSIVSKKLATGPRGVAISVGSGSGAYMATLDDARRLANSMADVAAGAGLASVMLLTDLDSVLGSTVGNAVAVAEAVDFLTGRRRDPRVADLVLSLSAEMIVLAGVESDLSSARMLAAARLDDGAAAERFARMVASMGGPADFVERAAKHLPAAPVMRPVYPERAGFVTGMDAKGLGLALVDMGGGRTRPEGTIDLAVGFSGFAQIGFRADEKTPLCVVHARDEASFERARRRVRAAVVLSPNKVADPGPVVRERIARKP
jgi:thymidine phosphorylase